MTLIVCTLGGGPVLIAHVVYIQLSAKLDDLCIHDLSGRSDGELLSSGSYRAIGGRARGTKVPNLYLYGMDVGYVSPSRHPKHRCTPFGLQSAYGAHTVTEMGVLTVD